jgi:hypothetical protein
VNRPAAPVDPRPRAGRSRAVLGAIGFADLRTMTALRYRDRASHVSGVRIGSHAVLVMKFPDASFSATDSGSA